MPEASSVPNEKASAMSPRVTVMPTEPTSSMIRRPIRSTSRIATIVTTMLVTEVMTEVRRALDSSNPTDCHSVVE